MPTITSQKLKITELVSIEGVFVKKVIIPSVNGLVADWTMFCKNPAIASKRTCVKPSEGVTGWMGERLSCAELAEVDGVLKAPWSKDEKTAAEIIITRPIRAFLTVNFACSNASGFPEEVIYIYPPLTKKNVAAAVANMIRVLRVWLVKVDISEFVSAAKTRAGFKSKHITAKKPVRNFIIKAMDRFIR
ncbi:MAG: hypothetical protein WCV81_02840 [Microgenomates group bacterium]|jgi:hypothetical protein